MPRRAAAKATDSAPSSVSKGTASKRSSSAASKADTESVDESATTTGAKNPKSPKSPKTPKSPKSTTGTATKRQSSAAKAKDEKTSASTTTTPKKATGETKRKRASSTAVAKKDKDAGAAGAASTATRKSKLPTWAQFPLLATLSFSMASLGYSLIGAVSKGELAAVSRSQDTWTEVGILASWRLIELAIGWFGDFDSLDVAALDLLSHGPSLYLLSAFYGLSPFTARLAFLVDIASAALPFHLMRGLAAVHKNPSKVYHGELAGWVTQLYTGALATGIYSVVVVLALRFVLPRLMVVYFSGIPSLEPAYGASYAAVLPMTIQFGLAASVLIYAPFATTAKAAEDDKIGQFDPASASLRETVEYNFLGYTAKTKVIVRRTAIAVAVTAVNTYLACNMTIFGIEPAGAAAYAGVWATGALLSGLGLAFVGGN